MWQPKQVALKDLIDDVDVIDDAKEDRRILGIQSTQILGDNIVEAAVGGERPSEDPFLVSTGVAICRNTTEHAS